MIKVQMYKRDKENYKELVRSHINNILCRYSMYSNCDEGREDVITVFNTGIANTHYFIKMSLVLMLVKDLAYINIKNTGGMELVLSSSEWKDVHHILKDYVNMEYEIEQV